MSLTKMLSRSTLLPALLSAALPVLAALSLLAGCRRDTATANEDDVANTLRALPLPDVRAGDPGSAGAGATVPVEPRMRVVITSQGIDADTIALMASWPAEQRAAFLKSLPADEAAGLPFAHKNIVKLAAFQIAPPDATAPGTLDIRALRQVLEYAAGLESGYRALAGIAEVGHKLNIYADRSAPYELITRVLYSAGQAEYSEYSFIVRSPGGDSALLPVHPPAFGEQGCPAPRVTISPQGLMIRLQRATHAGTAPSPMSPAAAGSGLAASAWHDRVLLSNPSTCPSVPLKEGRQDIEGAVALLRGIAGPIATCGVVDITAAPEITWGDVANVVAAITGQAGYPKIRFSVVKPGSNHASIDCTGGIDLASLANAAKERAPETGERAGGLDALKGSAAPGGSAAPSGQAPIGSTAVVGGDVDNAAKVVAGMSAGFRRCYIRGLSQDPNMKGALKVTARVGPNGEVLSATPSGGAGLSSPVISCVVARVQSAQFSPPSGGGATIVIPVTFTPSQ